MSKKMSKKKKVLIIILVIVAIYIATTIPYRIIKGDKIYGDELCSEISKPKKKVSPLENSKHLSHVPMVTGIWKCQICGWHGFARSAGSPDLCDLCAFITNRCKYCGGKLK